MINEIDKDIWAWYIEGYEVGFYIDQQLRVQFDTDTLENTLKECEHLSRNKNKWFIYKVVDHTIKQKFHINEAKRILKISKI